MYAFSKGALEWPSSPVFYCNIRDFNFIFACNPVISFKNLSIFLQAFSGVCIRYVHLIHHVIYRARLNAATSSSVLLERFWHFVIFCRFLFFLPQINAFDGGTFRTFSSYWAGCVIHLIAPSRQFRPPLRE